MKIESQHEIEHTRQEERTTMSHAKTFFARPSSLRRLPVSCARAD